LCFFQVGWKVKDFDKLCSRTASGQATSLPSGFILMAAVTWCLGMAKLL
jgi:hypothetical protein